MDTEQRMLKNFINKYGHKGLKRISFFFLSGHSNQAIADEFNVTRQRVLQWQKAFTEKKVTLKPSVVKEIN